MVLQKTCFPAFSLVMTVLNVCEPGGGKGACFACAGAGVPAAWLCGVCAAGCCALASAAPASAAPMRAEERRRGFAKTQANGDPWARKSVFAAGPDSVTDGVGWFMMASRRLG